MWALGWWGLGPWSGAVSILGDWSSLAIVAGIFFAGQMIEGNYLTPKLVGIPLGCTLFGFCWRLVFLARSLDLSVC